jgi:23S rRNA (uracil1939-C5)-methyltransferase
VCYTPTILAVRPLSPLLGCASVEWDSRYVAADQPFADLLAPATVRRWISGRYLVAVERLLEDGTASGTVTSVREEPTPSEFALVFPQSPPPMIGAGLTFLGGLPGETVEVEVSWSLPRQGRRGKRRPPRPAVRLLAVCRDAAERVAPRCPVFGACGGCQLQHLSYGAQLQWKTGRVAEAVRSVGLPDAPVLPTIGCRIPWNYRNQMRFSINREGKPGLTGHHSRRILPLSDCPIAHPRINDALALLANQCLRPPQVLVRYGDSSHHLLVQPLPEQVDFRHELEDTDIELRESDMEESLGGVSFRIRPSSFFQTNTDQANRMMELVLERIPPGEEHTWVDAYCGVGTFARLMATRVGSVIAIEESSSAVAAARSNLVDVPNVELLQGKVEELLPRLSRHLDGLVIDPPRAGCQRPVLETLAADPLPRVIYVSCNPDTLARDLAYLCHARNAYRVTSIQPLDMFPQTAHIESITLLEAC